MSDVPKYVELKKIPVSKALQKVGKATSATLVKLTNRAPTSVKQTLKMMYTSNKIHIGDYEVTKRGKVTRVWAWGDGIDAKEPPSLRHREEFVPRPDEAAAWLRNPI